MEVTKPGMDCIDTVTEVSREIEVKTETKFSVKEDPDEKSIASDSELMKILEEDNTTSDESKAGCKKDDLEHQNKSRILLDALTKNDILDGKCKTLLPSDVKTNIGNNGKIFILSWVKKQKNIIFLYSVRRFIK